MANTPAQRVAGTVRAEMAKQRKTQMQLADALGISQTAVSRRITGEVPFDVAELANVAAFLGIQPAALLEEAAVA